MALEGTLQDMSLGDLFQVFRMGPKTGLLLLTSGDERGIIYVADGRPVDAGVVRGTERTVLGAHDEAVIRMMLWDDANFIFRHDPAAAQRPARITHDSEWLVMEGMRQRSDPTRALPYHTISLDTQLQLSPLPSSAESGVSLDVNQWRILSQVSSCPNLRTVCDATGISPAQAIRTVAELLSIGLVEIVIPVAPAPRPRQRSDPPPAARSSQRLEPAMAGVPADVLADADSSPVAGRSLLDAIMRRIRGL